MSTAPKARTAREDLEEAYQLYRLELRRFFELNSRDPQAVDDLLQTMYLGVRKIRCADEVRDPRQYLFRAAWNLLHSANRRARTERSHAVSCNLDDFDNLAERSNRLWLEDDSSTALQHVELDRALAQLPRACRVAVLRQYRDNKSYKEIAEELGVTVHAVKKYVMRALNHFRIHFNSIDVNDRDGS